MIFEGFKKRPKRESESERIVLLEASKRQNRPGPGANCLFGEFKKTKESCNPVEFLFGGFKKTKESQTRGNLSFWRSQKDKRDPDREQTVFLESSKRQKRAVIRVNCPFGGFKKTKGNWNPVELSFWGLQKDKRKL
ncbi:hypothetical protein [Heyndrickxia faecalis]|uniref:hypothetical protein n=1 Tax=Heyndrickxia faecalis TaxID=2824910 RepID=UPI003D22E351